MKLETEIRDVATRGVREVARATIKATPKIFDFFANQTYQDKKIAIVRELAANAVDSHVMSGKADTPIEIWLPTDLDPTFRVRDRGLGMSHEFMMTRFMAYTDGSTKDGDNVAIGGFGIGSKSPFAYTDTFTIRSVFDGLVSVYSVFKDEEGIPAIALLDQRDTDEGNGVEVSFAVQAGDAAEFEEAAFKSLRYFEPLPIVHNAFKGHFEPPEYLSRGKTWGMRKTAGDLNIIMGGIMYPCNTYSLSSELRYDDKLQPLIGYGLDLRLPIGSCDVALSREGLSYTEKTNIAIRKGLEGAVDEIAESFATMFDDYDSLWEAKEALGAEVGLDNNRYGYSSRGKFLQNNALYRGHAFDPYISISNVSVWEIESNRSRRARTTLRTAKWETYSEYGLRLAPVNVELVIIDDLPLSPKSRTTQKIRNYVEENCQRSGSIYVFRANRDILADLGNPPFVVRTSSLPEPPIEKRTKSSRPNVRLFTYDGREKERVNYVWNVPYVTNLNPGPDGAAGRRKGVSEVASSDQPSVGILVEMENFNLPPGLRQKMAAGLFQWDELHFANASDAAKLKKTWTMFDDEFDQRLKNTLAAYPDLPQRLALFQDENLTSYFNYIRITQIHQALNTRQQSTPFGRICKLYAKYIEPITSEQTRLAPFVEAKLPPRVKPETLVDKIDSKLKEMIELTGRSDKYNHLVLEFI